MIAGELPIRQAPHTQITDFRHVASQAAEKGAGIAWDFAGVGHNGFSNLRGVILSLQTVKITVYFPCLSCKGHCV
jgi:hypothetical protein